MPNGRVLGIFVSPKAGAPMQSVGRVKAVAGSGLEGDRYLGGKGTFSKQRKHEQITLIEREAIEGAFHQHGIELRPIEARRNVLTDGVALNHLVDRNFRVGGARLRGVKLCEPCGHLEKLTRDGVKDSLIHRGGLRAEILTTGPIAVGDLILSDMAGRREQAGVVPICHSKGKLRVAVTKSRIGDAWIVPKGHVEYDESVHLTAAREAVEELGVDGEVLPELIGEYRYEKRGIPRRVQLFPMIVHTVMDDWPERDVRPREWLTVEEAVERVTFEEIKVAIRRAAEAVAGRDMVEIDAKSLKSSR